MKLLRITLEGQYKGLKNQTFEFDQSENNVMAFVGLNGSGKSQLLEMICESFSYLERVTRPEFRVRKPLGFGAVIEYQIRPYLKIDDITYQKVMISNDGSVQCFERDQAGNWEEKDNKNIDLPLNIIGYSSGLNENLQRSFMKNSLQFFDVMKVRAARRIRVSENINEEKLADLNRYYCKRYPGVFDTQYGEGSKHENFLTLREKDTKAPVMKFLDYDSSALLMACMSILEPEELDVLLPEVKHRYPQKIVVHYDLRKTALEEDAIRDIRQLIELVSTDNVEGLIPRTKDADYDLYELDYLCAHITIDLTNNGLRKRMQERYLDMPIRLFERLYKIQLLGVQAWQTADKKLLRDDSFQGNIKKPLKTKLPLSVTELLLADEEGNLIPFDDLSDGEAQLIFTVAGARTFRDETTLFVFDEPETHLNPSWRTQFHRHLNQALNFDMGTVENPNCQVLLSTHSPFLISSLHKQDVFSFEKRADGSVAMTPSYIQTYGAAFEVLIKQFFGLRSLISQTAVEDIKHQLSALNDAEASAWIETNIGDSMEKSYLLRKLKN
jgi:predicted ATPase